MKSSKLKATLAAVSAIAVMASASTSFAATVTTKSTYNASSDKVSVEATVSDLEANKEVTYLVTGDSDNIVYIDQATLDGSGAATFSYKIDKTKIKNLTTKVTYGTDGNIDAPKEADGLGFDNVTGSATNATIEYYTDAACETGKIDSAVAGKGEKIYAKIIPNEGYAIDTVTIGETPQEIKTVYTLTAGQTITVTTKETVVTPGVESSDVNSDVTTDMKVEENGETKQVTSSVTTVLKVKGTPDEYGVLYEVNGVLTAFPAAAAGDNNYAAVRILTTGEKEINSSDLTPYYKVGDKYYDAKTDSELTAE